jgi:uncharacterized protein YbjT (DUF2867 family)
MFEQSTINTDWWRGVSVVYLISGATGNVGSLVVQRLIEVGVRPRVFVRDPNKARALYGDRVEVTVGDLADATAMQAALTGADKLFLVNSGPELAARDEIAAKAARAGGVKHLVKLSSYDARANVGTGVWHARGESAIRSSGIPFTFVQASGFMSNALFWARSIKADGVVRTSTGDGKIPFIHSQDIADVATKALTSHLYDGESLPITGPEALSYAEMAAKIATAIGKPIQCKILAEEEERRQMIARGDSPEIVAAHLSIYRAIREGHLATVTDTVERVLGRKPITFDQWVQENATSFF